MKLRRLYIIPILLIVLILAACNMPSVAPADAPDNDPAATDAALTADAKNQQQPQATAQFTPLPTLKPTFTPVYTTPMVGVTTRSNCRTGPSQDYELVTAIDPGEMVTIVGSFPPLYWLVETDKGTCWLYGEFATPIGSFDQVPTVTPPPTPTPGKLGAPIVQKWDFFCNLQTGLADVTLVWSDTTNAETGYRIYRDGNRVSELPANSTQFSESVVLLSGQSAKYTIEAYTANQTASSSIITITCP